LLPPFAPAAEIWARTMVESNIWIKWADALISASVSKKASNTPALLSRSKRFHTEFQWPKRSGSARQRTFSTVKKCIASRNNRSSAALRPRRGRQARKTSSVFAQSVSVILVDIADLQISRQPMNHTGFVPGTPKTIPESIRPHSLTLLWQICDFWDSPDAECVIHGEPALMEAGDGYGLAERSQALA